VAGSSHSAAGTTVFCRPCCAFSPTTLLDSGVYHITSRFITYRRRAGLRAWRVGTAPRDGSYCIPHMRSTIDRIWVSLPRRRLLRTAYGLLDRQRLIAPYFQNSYKTSGQHAAVLRAGTAFCSMACCGREQLRGRFTAPFASAIIGGAVCVIANAVINFRMDSASHLRFTSHDSLRITRIIKKRHGWRLERAVSMFACWFIAYRQDFSMAGSLFNRQPAFRRRYGLLWFSGI